MARPSKLTLALLMSGILTLATLGCQDESSGPVERPTTCPSTYAQRVADLVNAERADAGLPLLLIDMRLAEAAQGHAADMAINNFLSHTGSDSSTSAERVLAAGYPYSATGENVAGGQSTPAAVVAAWMASPGHRANILQAGYEHLGIGYAHSNRSAYSHYWANSFGSSQDDGELPPGGCHP